MKELRQLKDLRHENLNAFIGIFIDPNSPSLIFEYGHRGSLEVKSQTKKIFFDVWIFCFCKKDILKKEEIKLDWNFKWSMLNDLVRVNRFLVV